MENEQAKYFGDNYQSDEPLIVPASAESAYEELNRAANSIVELVNSGKLSADEALKLFECASSRVQEKDEPQDVAKEEGSSLKLVK